MRTPLVLVAAALVGLAGCDSASDGSPEVISPAAFTFDAGAFPDESSRTATAAGQNFRVAALRVGVVSAIVGANLILPEAATRAATRVEPERNEDGSLVYSTVVDVLGSPTEIRLTGVPRGGDVDWTLTTAPDGFERFTFYTATTTFNGRSGTWSLFNPDVDGSVLGAEFEIDETPEVTFIVPEGRDNAGTSVLYETDGDVRTFDFVGTDGTRSLVVWNTQTNAGSIEASDFRGGARVCWDASLQDVACESV